MDLTCHFTYPVCQQLLTIIWTLHHCLIIIKLQDWMSIKYGMSKLAVADLSYGLMLC